MKIKVKAKKRTRKVLTKRERENLVRHVSEMDPLILTAVTNAKLHEQSFFSDALVHLVDILFADHHHLVEDILKNHQKHFGELYFKCKQEVDPYLQFQLQWQQYCSAFLLSRAYPLSAINLDESAEQEVAAIRMNWLEFCDCSDMPVPESNPVMIVISSAIYDILLERAEKFQKNLSDNGESVSTSLQLPVVKDGEDVHLRIGGAAICTMLHLHYQQIKGCTTTQRDKLSQEITILQAMLMKDKTNLPHYLQYRNRGFMYFPDASFVPFIQSVHEVVRGVVSIGSLEEHIIEVWVCLLYVYASLSLLCCFFRLYTQKSGRKVICVMFTNPYCLNYCQTLRCSLKRLWIMYIMCLFAKYLIRLSRKWYHQPSSKSHHRRVWHLQLMSIFDQCF